MTAFNKPVPLPSNAAEACRTNLLLESMQKDIGTMAEGVVDLQRQMAAMGVQLQAVVDDVAMIKPTVQRNTQDIAEMKAGITRIEQKLTSFDQRLMLVEQKVTA